MSILFGIDGKPRNVKEIYIGVGGQPRKVKEGYVGIDGQPRKFYTAHVPVPVHLSSFEIGSLVSIRENGVPVPYIVSGHEYDMSAIGMPETPSVLVRQAPVSQVTHSDYQSALGEFGNALDPAVAKVDIVYAKIKSCLTLFLDMLGLVLAGYDTGMYRKLTNADTLKNCDQWLADTRADSSSTMHDAYRAYTNSLGNAFETNGKTSRHGLRPILFLPGETQFDRLTGDFIG